MPVFWDHPRLVSELLSREDSLGQRGGPWVAWRLEVAAEGSRSLGLSVMPKRMAGPARQLRLLSVVVLGGR